MMPQDIDFALQALNVQVSRMLTVHAQISNTYPPVAATTSAISSA